MALLHRHKGWLSRRRPEEPQDVSSREASIARVLGENEWGQATAQGQRGAEEITP
jgi:hypothetical protein